MLLSWVNAEMPWSVAAVNARMQRVHPRGANQILSSSSWHGRLARGPVGRTGFQPVIWRRFAPSTGKIPVPLSKRSKADLRPHPRVLREKVRVRGQSESESGAEPFSTSFSIIHGRAGLSRQGERQSPVTPTQRRDGLRAVRSSVQSDRTEPVPPPEIQWALVSPSLPHSLTRTLTLRPHNTYIALSSRLHS